MLITTYLVLYWYYIMANVSTCKYAELSDHDVIPVGSVDVIVVTTMSATAGTLGR